MILNGASDRYPGMIFTGVENLNNCFYTSARFSGRPTHYIDGDKLKEISENNGYSVISSDSDEVFSFDTKDNALYYSSLENPEPEEIVDEILGFGVTPDFKHIFYITEDEELYVANADGSDEKKLDDDVCGDNYKSGLEFIGELIPRVIGDKYIIYGTNDGDIYMCDINGEKTEIEAELDEWDYNFANDYSNMYGRVVGYNRNSFVYPNRNFITYVDDGDLYIIDGNGEISLLLEDIE